MGLDYRRALLTERRYKRTQCFDTNKTNSQGHLVGRHIQRVESGDERAVLWNDDTKTESPTVKG
jgi:hypothetical protein